MFPTNWNDTEKMNISELLYYTAKIDQVVASGVNNVVPHPMNSIVYNGVEPC